MRRVAATSIAMMLVAGILVGCNKAEEPAAKKDAATGQKAEEDWQPEVAKEPGAVCDDESHDHSADDHAGHDHAGESEKKEEKKEEKKSDHDTNDHSGHDHDGHAH